MRICVDGFNLNEKEDTIPKGDTVNRVPILGDKSPDDLTAPRNLLPSVGAQFSVSPLGIAPLYRVLMIWPM